MSEATAFIPPHALNTAVLFLVFNRLDTTKQVFEAIRQAKPPRLYVAADGARANKEGEADKAQAVRDYIMQNIDWKCEVKTLFREENLGCKYAVSGAITWFFENEEEGIILEDDCLPNQSFFWYCEELLEKYKYETNIMMISGDNFTFSDNSFSGSYAFSKYALIWGWATWRNSWNMYDISMKSWKSFNSSNKIKQIHPRFDERLYWKKVFKKMTRGRGIDTWDYQWALTMWVNDGVSAYPNVNLIKNIGFGELATHAVQEDRLSNMRIEDVSFPLTHTSKLNLDTENDTLICDNFFLRNQKNQDYLTILRYIKYSIQLILQK